MTAGHDEPPRATLLQTVRAVGASFFGVRGGRAHEDDMKRLNPVVVIGVGIGMAAAFVATLILIVRAVVK
ncbi:MAG: hypothetical protein RJA99_17 [Pseudomonadota bacterium]|jgi:hypothetical protein